MANKSRKAKGAAANRTKRSAGSQQRRVSRLRRAEQAIEAMIALALTPRPVTDAEIETFLREHDAEKHPLTKTDRAALKKSRPELFRQIKSLLTHAPDQRPEQKLKA